ncbi:MAG TPA: hypothetical protein VEX18_05275 [Polyangiaceae bacterium]|nr:hypothetical protein [Polyangiaceae bacterium]
MELFQHQRATARQWFEDWWNSSFGVIAEQDLGEDMPLLTTSDNCFTLKLDLPDQPDLAPIQTAWALSRWLCARGASVVLDVHAFRYRTREDVEKLGFDEADVLRDVKLVLETDATQGDLHLMHTRGLCKFARPELTCFVTPDDASVSGRILNQIARTLMEGARAEQIRLRITDGVEVVTRPSAERALLESLGLEAAVSLVRSDGTPLAGIARLAPGV